MKQLIKLAAFFLIIMTVFTSCKKDAETTTPTGLNKPPIAIAGADKIYYWSENTIVDLDGSGTDADGSITSFRWLKLSGPNYLPNKINDHNSAKTSVFNLNPGTHEFLLTVRDDKAAEAKDTVRITVIDTLTTTGKEYLFKNLPWVFEDEFFGAVNYINAGSPIFYNPDANIQVSILLSSSSSWQIIQKDGKSLPPGDFYYSAGSLFLSVSRAVLHSTYNLEGTKATFKVKFL